MKIVFCTLFPEMLSGPLNNSILKRAQKNESVSFEFVQIRDFASDAHKSVDDRPYGGGAGMILRVDIVDRAISKAKELASGKTAIILLDPQGKQYTQHDAQTFAAYDTLILICGHYEGVDERIRTLVDIEISIGDYVLTGGEIPALVVADSVTRLVDGVLAKTNATLEESFSTNTLEYPQYTRPPVYKGMSVPQILLSGNHKDIREWRVSEARERTQKRRPDLIVKKDRA